MTWDDNGNWISIARHAHRTRGLWAANHCRKLPIRDALSKARVACHRVPHLLKECGSFGLYRYGEIFALACEVLVDFPHRLVQHRGRALGACGGLALEKYMRYKTVVFHHTERSDWRFNF